MEYQAYNDETQRLNKRLDVLKRAKAALCNEMDKEFFTYVLRYNKDKRKNIVNKKKKIRKDFFFMSINNEYIHNICYYIIAFKEG